MENFVLVGLFPRASGGLEWPPDPWSSGPSRKQGGQARFAALIGQPNTFFGLNFDLGCPNRQMTNKYW
jgi:hypothetical protein